MTDPSTMTVAQLKEALKTRGLDATGLKAALVARLRAALESSDADAEANDGASDPRSRPPLPNVNPQPAREHRRGVRTRGGGGPRVRLLRDARTRITIDETPPLRPRRIIWPPGRGIRDRRRARPSGSRPAMPPPDGHVAARSRDTREHVMSPSIASTHSWTRTDRPLPSIRSPQIPPPRIRPTKRRRRPPSPTPRSPRPYPTPSRRRSASAGAAPRMPRLAMPRLAMPTTPRMMKTKTAKKKPRCRGRTPTRPPPPPPSPRSRCPP